MYLAQLDAKLDKYSIAHQVCARFICYSEFGCKETQLLYVPPESVCV